MQKLISKYGLAAHLAFLAVAPLLVLPFADLSDISKAVLWLSLLAFAWLVNAPSRINAERSTSEARRRVFKSIVEDPLSWVLLSVTIIVGIRALNNGITLAYDAESYLWYLSEPAISVMPASSGDAGFPIFVSSFLGFVIYLIAKHALGKSARLAAGYMVGLVTGIAGIVMMYQAVVGNETVGELAKCSLENPSYVGSSFGIILILFAAILPGAFERRWNVALAGMPIGFGGLIAALFTFAPVYMALAYFVVAILVLLYSVFWTFKNLGKTVALKLVMIFIISTFLALVFVYAMSFKPLMAKFALLSSGILPAAEAEVSARLSAISMKVWKAKLWLGSGLGTFPQSLRFNAGEEDWALISVQQLTPINGWSYLLTERGIVGALLIATPALFFLWAYVSRVLAAVKQLPNPMVFVAPLSAIVVAALTTFNTSLFRIETMPFLVLCVALSINSWVKEKTDGK